MNSTREMRHRAIAAGWLKADETPLFSRLRFPMSLDHPDCIFDENRAARDAVLTELLSGDVRPMPNSPCLSHSNDHDIVLSEVDRYNLPLRTVLSACTGLVRSDPYYPPQFLQKFYAQHYRQLYRGKKYSAGHFMAEQITHGQRIMWRTALSKRARVLDVGCGMGGNLIPFKWEGHETIGCDWGDDYAQKGRQLGLDIRVGGLEAVADAGPFDLIICSHVLEHAVDP
ncbi:MAG TPA: class I SAM-dependent methyltransferase, partial [Tepidisphaeraceae bacterium]|nr:class I SAM-dependent methyltransferase [Tepidisphaeraceae bacterium]